MVPRTWVSIEVDAALVQHWSDALIRLSYVYAPVRALQCPLNLVRHLGYPIFMTRQLPLSLIGRFSLALLALALSTSLRAQSFYPTRPDDSRAVELTKGTFAAHADGESDDADALQKAIDRAVDTRSGLVLIPEGRYRLGKTVYVWQGIRLLGYGAKRPVFVLGRNTPGFQEGSGRYMLHFADNRPQAGGPIVDASEFTFYSGASNIDFELQDGNPAAIAIRFHVAQHSALTHMDFKVGSARAALEDIGNQAWDIHVHGGEYGIITKRTAPVWQFLLMDSTFDGQRAAAIRTMEAGFTLVRVRISNTPVALQIAPGEVEQLYARDLQLQNISGTAFVAGNWRNNHSAVTFANIACSNVPRFFGGEQPIAAPGQHYVVENFSLGLDIGADGRELGIALHHRERALPRPASGVPNDVPALPPMETWVNVRTIGVKGEPTSDDTAALQAAIDHHPVLFFPSGTYRVSASLTLKPDTVLIGLNPGTTQIALIDGSAPFAGEGQPVGVVVAPKGGRNIVSALSVSTGVRNPRAAGVMWLAGKTSLLDDVSFPARGNEALGDSQAADLIVRDGGGGIFRGNWPHDTSRKVGLRVENTSTRGRIYQMSVEHHARIETQFKDVRNWEIYALQTEEENPAGADAYALDVEDSKGLLFANTYMYRVSRNVHPKTHAILVRRSDDIRFEGVKVFSQTRLAFDNAVLEEGSGVSVRSHFFTRFTLTKDMKAPATLPLPAIFAKDGGLEKLATGFSNVSGFATSDAGELFFTDAANRKIFRWNTATKQADLLAEIPGQPQVLGFVAPSHLLAIANEKAVYHLDLIAPGQPEVIKEVAELLPDTKLLLPVGLHNQLFQLRDLLEHRGYNYRRRSNTAIINVVNDEPRGYFYAPGTKTAIMAGGTWRPNLQASNLAAFAPGDSHYVTSEDDGRTWVARLDNYRAVSTTPFVDRGGTSVATDTAGNVYIASGEVWIYDRNGKQLGVLEVPERPGALAFGGADGRTLYIGARSSLYSIRTVTY